MTTRTVLHNMLFGIALIVLLQWVFLGNLRSAVIVGATIPFALLFAVGILVLRGESANLLSVGAIDFGLIVDSTVIMVEAIFRWLGQPLERRGPDTLDAQGAGLTGKLLEIYRAGSSVGRSIFFSAGIIIAADRLPYSFDRRHIVADTVAAKAQLEARKPAFVTQLGALF